MQSANQFILKSGLHLSKTETQVLNNKMNSIFGSTAVDCKYVDSFCFTLFKTEELLFSVTPQPMRRLRDELAARIVVLRVCVWS